MKRILTLLAILTICFNQAFSQTPPPEDQSFDELLTALSDDEELYNYDLTLLEGEIDPETREEIEQTLVDEGYEQGTIDTIMGTVDDINDGTAGTLGEILEDPEIQDAMVDIIAQQAVNELFADPETEQQMTDTLKAIKGLLSILGGFGQATANASVAGSLMGYQGYDLFAISLGLATVGMSPSLDSIQDIMDAQSEAAEEEFLDEINKLDVQAGVSVQSFILNFGLNTSFLVDGLYLGGVLGSSSVKLTTDETVAEYLGMPVFTGPSLVGDEEESTNGEPGVAFEANLDSATYGIRAYYQLIDPFKIPILLRWNGLNVGTGFIYNHFNVNAQADMSPQLELPDGTLGVEFGIQNTTYTIPLEVSTGIRLLSALNLSIGAGVDLQFGESNVSFDLLRSGEDSISTRVMTAVLDEILSRENMNFPYSETYNPEFLNPRLQAGVGLGIGPLTLLDVTATYYVTTGFALGANIIFRW